MGRDTNVEIFRDTVDLVKNKSSFKSGSSSFNEETGNNFRNR